MEELADHTPFGSRDELDEALGALVLGVVMLAKDLNLGAEIEVFFEKELFVGCLEGADIVLGKASSLETNDVESAGGRGIAIDDHEGGNVLHDTGEAGGHGVFADATELMDRA